jgi:hypothetical protein
VIGGRGGNVLNELGPVVEKPDEELSPEALQLRRFRRAMRGESRRPFAVLKGQLGIDSGEVE